MFAISSQQHSKFSGGSSWRRMMEKENRCEMKRYRMLIRVGFAEKGKEFVEKCVSLLYIFLFIFCRATTNC